MQTNYDPIDFNEESLDLEKIIRKYLRFWPWLLVGLVLALGIAHLMNERQAKIYQNSIELLIHEKTEPLLDLAGQESFSSSFNISGSKINNQIQVLTSRTLTRNTLRTLDFGVEYYQKGTFVNQELYPNQHFSVEFDSLWPQSINVPFQIKKNNDNTWNIVANWEKASLYSFPRESFIGQVTDVNIDVNVDSNQWVENNAFRIRVVPKEGMSNTPTSDQEYIVFLRDIGTLTGKFSNLQAQIINNTSIVKLFIQGESRKKNEVFLNTHAQKFLNLELEKKNIRAQKTIDFIDDQLDIVSQSLVASESNIDEFMSSEQILSIDFEAQRVFQRMEDLQKQKAELLARDKYYKYLQSYLQQPEDDGSDLVPPSSLGVDDPLLSAIINDLIQLYTQKAELRINYREDNPILNNMDVRIRNAKLTAVESLNGVIQQNNMKIEDIEKNIEDMSVEISDLPESQRNLFTMERQFDLYNELFKFLQNKKLEIEITKSGFTPVHEIIEPSSAGLASLISPQRNRTLTIAAFIGLALPLLIIFLVDFFNDKVRSTDDIEKIKDFSFLGIISRNNTKAGAIISYANHSVLAESFRSLRTNIQFLLPHGEKPVILTTSTLLNEGKTFVSLNIASGFANLGKKVILLSFDLRKPKLHRYLNSEMPEGITNYITSGSDYKKFIQKSEIENLDIIYSGQVPPNPAELISSPLVDKMFDELKQDYDYIFVDTPPIGMVSDSLLLMNHCNAILYIVRHNKTPNKYLQHTLRGLKDKDVKNINIILNDVPPPGRFSGYSEYKYQYSYYESKS